MEFELDRWMNYLACMSTRFFFEEYTIEKDWQERELHYLVFDRQGYVCRLVPGDWGWELSAIDLKLDQPIPAALVDKLSDYIVRLEA